MDAGAPVTAADRDEDGLTDELERLLGTSLASPTSSNPAPEPSANPPPGSALPADDPGGGETDALGEPVMDDTDAV